MFHDHIEHLMSFDCANVKLWFTKVTFAEPGVRKIGLFKFVKKNSFASIAVVVVGSNICIQSIHFRKQKITEEVNCC